MTQIKDSEAATSVTVDGVAQRDNVIGLTDDRAEHAVEITVSRAKSLIAAATAVA